MNRHQLFEMEFGWDPQYGMRYVHKKTIVASVNKKTTTQYIHVKHDFRVKR